jgi:hypothetical protein
VPTWNAADPSIVYEVDGRCLVTKPLRLRSENLVRFQAFAFEFNNLYRYTQGKRVKGAVAFDKAPPRKTTTEEAAEAAEAAAEEASAAAVAAAAAAALLDDGDEGDGGGYSTTTTAEAVARVIAAATAVAAAAAAAVAPSYSLVDPRVVGGAWATMSEAPKPTANATAGAEAADDADATANTTAAAAAVKDGALLNPAAAWEAAVAPSKPAWGFAHAPTGRGGWACTSQIQLTRSLKPPGFQP